MKTLTAQDLEVVRIKSYLFHISTVTSLVSSLMRSW